MKDEKPATIDEALEAFGKAVLDAFKPLLVAILKGMNWIVYKMLDFIRWCRHDK